jgi:hypothetical protein
MTSQGGYIGNPVVYKGKLYIIWVSSAGYYQLAEFDGTDLKLIPNPGNGGLQALNRLYTMISCMSVIE